MNDLTASFKEKAMKQRNFKSDPQARMQGVAEAERWMIENRGSNKRQSLAESEARLAEHVIEQAKELDETEEADAAAQHRLLASFHQAKADRLVSLTFEDLGGNRMSGQPQHRRKIPLNEWLATRGQLVLPIATIIGVIVLGSTFGAPLWLTLIGAGVAARIVAMRRRSSAWACRFWGVVPTVPMLLGYYWIFWAAVIVHVLLWPHPTERPQGQGGNGQDRPNRPRRI